MATCCTTTKSHPKSPKTTFPLRPQLQTLHQQEEKPAALLYFGQADCHHR